jgi:hypothetical protein
MVRAIATVHFATAKAEIIYDSVSWGKKSGISPFLRQGEKLGQIFEVLELDAHLHVQCNESE